MKRVRSGGPEESQETSSTSVRAEMRKSHPELESGRGEFNLNLTSFVSDLVDFLHETFRQ